MDNFVETKREEQVSNMTTYLNLATMSFVAFKTIGRVRCIES